MTKTCQFHCEPILGVLVVLLSYSTANSDEPKSAAKMTSCHVVGPEIGDVSRILHVDAYRGTFQFDNAVKKVRLVIELYSKGKKLPETLLPAIQCIPQYRANSGQFAIQIADLDYLPLGNGKKNQCRVNTELQMSSKSGIGDSSAVNFGRDDNDIPKDKINLSELTGSGDGNPFEGSTPKGNRLPVFWLSGGKILRAGGDFQRMIADNPEGEFVFVYLEFE